MKQNDCAGQKTPILPIVFGGDVGAYTLGLEAYEAFGCRSICVAHEPVDLITRSKIFDVVQIEPQASDQSRLAVIRHLAKMNPDRTYLLLTNDDLLIGFLVRNRRELGSEFIIPFPDWDTVELLNSKERFAQVCERLGVPTPPSISVDLADQDGEDWDSPPIPFRFPVIAKADDSSEYDKIQFLGKEKVYFVDSAPDLDALWQKLREVGFKGQFLVQELIPGDDSHKRTVTMYVGSRGNILLKAAAQVLLEDPTPTMIGNPAAMISRSMPDLWETASRILTYLDYRGFANFDLKVDPRDGVAYFFELNPRAGRSSYFVVAGGHNPLEVMAQDLIFEESKPVEATRHALYTLLPVPLVLHYVKNPSLRTEVRQLVKKKRIVNPLHAPVERDTKRKVIVHLQGLNHFRKFHRHFKSDF